jgi:hypothetical protein
LDDIDDLRLLSAHATPLSSVLGAVRAAADARTRGGGLGSSSSTGPGGSSAAGRLMGSQVGAPLADTFSAGGRRCVDPWTNTYCIALLYVHMYAYMCGEEDYEASA